MTSHKSSSAHHFRHSRAPSGSQHVRQHRSPSNNSGTSATTNGERHRKSGSNPVARVQRRYARPRPHTLPDSFGKHGAFGNPNPAAVSAASIIDNSRAFCLPNVRNQAVLQRLSVNLTETLASCNKHFRYSKDHNPRRILSSPSEKVLNGNYDNKHSDLVLTVNDVLTPESPANARNVKYRVIDLLGKGTFGQVVKCEVVPTDGLEATRGLVAVKVIKNKPAYYNQALIEIKILKKLNRDFDPKNDHNIVRIVSYFIYQKHLCLVFELLNVNLFDLVKQNRYRGLSCNLIRAFIKQVLKTLVVLKKASIIHCDLKPENILLMNLRTPRVKVIDFGSACFEGHTVYQYIQSRFYRSPEVLCGAEYTCQIDMWSLGCIAAELFLGLPLFPGKDEYHQTRRIMEMRGEFPSYLLAKGTKTQRLFAANRSQTGETVFKLKTAQQFCNENNLDNTPPKKYFKTHNLRELIMGYQYKSDLSDEKKAQEVKTRECFYDFLRGVLNTDPRERWTPTQAYQHPFVRNVDWEGPFDPSKIPASSLTSPGTSSSNHTSSSSSRYRRRHDRHRSDRHRHHHRSTSGATHQQQQASARSSRHHHHQKHLQQQQAQQSQTAPAPFSPRQRSFSNGGPMPGSPSSSSTDAQQQQRPPPAFHTQPAPSTVGSSNRQQHHRHAHRAMSSHTAPRQRQTISPSNAAANAAAKRSSPTDSDMRAASPTSAVSSSGRGTPSGSSARSKPQLMHSQQQSNGKSKNTNNPFSDPMPHRSRAFSDDMGGARPSSRSSKGVAMSKASAASLLRQRQMHQQTAMSSTMPLFRTKVESDDVQMLGTSPPGTPRNGPSAAAAAAMSMTMPMPAGVLTTAAAGGTSGLSMDLSAPPINGSGNNMRSPRTTDGQQAPPKVAVNRKFSSSLASTPETTILQDTPMDRFSDGAVSFNHLQNQSPTANGPIQQFGFDIPSNASGHHHLAMQAAHALAQQSPQGTTLAPPFVSIPGGGMPSGMGSGAASPLSMSRRSSYGMCYAPPPPIGGNNGSYGGNNGSFSASSTIGSFDGTSMTSSLGSTGSLTNMFQKSGARSPLEFSPPSRDFHKQSQNFFDLNIAELGGVSTGLTPITHGRFLMDNPSLGTANSAAQNAFYSPQYGQAHHRQVSQQHQQQQHPSQHQQQHRGSFQFYSVTAPAGDLSNHAVSPRAHQANMTNALSPQLTAQQHRMRGQSIGQAYGFDLASLSHHASSQHQRFNSSGGGGGGMQVSAPGSGMNSPRGTTTPQQYPPAFATAGSGNPSPSQQPE